jgi:hypothetical protein
MLEFVSHGATRQGSRSARGLRVVAAACASLLVATSLASAAIVQPYDNSVRLASSSGDWRCFFGPGIQVWQDINKGGPSMILCGNAGRWNNLSNLAENLDWFANWNDRISSFELFNTGAAGPHSWRLCIDANGGGSCMGPYSTSVYVSNVGSSYNDKISSVRDG